MKTYSFIIICLTLGVFYSLAVKMEHQNNLEQRSNSIQVSLLKNNTDAPNLTLIKSCSNHSSNLTTDQKDNHHVGINDDFSMQVTGKAHKYLNTGVSFIEYDTSNAGAANSDTKLSGS